MTILAFLASLIAGCAHERETFPQRAAGSRAPSYRRCLDCGRKRACPLLDPEFDPLAARQPARRKLEVLPWKG